MERYIYISCLENERELPEVTSLCRWLRSHGCVTIFSGESGYTFKQFAAFVAIVGYGYNSASWLNGELHDACSRNRSHPEHLPLLFGLSIEGAGLPRCSRDIIAPADWLDSEQSYTRLLPKAEGQEPAKENLPKISEVMSDAMRATAEVLAEAAREAEPATKKILLFPSAENVRLLYVDPTASLSGEGTRIAPYYFRPAPNVGIDFESAVAMIRPEEEGRLALPEGWGTWEDAETL